jgi:hypothetical protein
MANLDPRIEAIRAQYGLERSDFWELPQKKGTWIAKHSALEVAAVKGGIVWSPPQVLEADGAGKCAAVCVSGSLGERVEWSIGEASPANNKNAYPFAMAEKRGKDRVVLKLLGIHGLAYSEDEADDFKALPQNGPISEQQAASLMVQINDTGSDLKKFLKVFGVEKITTLPLSKLAQAETMLARKAAETAKAKEAAQ